MSTKKRLNLLGAGALALLLAVFIAACGGDDSDESADSEHTDGAFISEMVPHHEAAIEMAQLASTEAEHQEIKQLAQRIIGSQGEEITKLEAAHQRLFGGPIRSEDHGDLGLSEEDSGMAHDASALQGADPFDQEFIDMMIPHHQGAIRMSRVELASGGDLELKALAEAIIEAQSSEIDEMNAWRQKWYGAPSPAGGVPAEGDEGEVSHEEMGH
jgi:uncharacterized protein (DUF305 family)